MSIDGQKDVDGLKRAGAAVAEDGARSAPQLAYDFPGTTCISVNDELAHGIPSRRRVLCEGDLVNIDVSAELDGYWADSGASFPVGHVARTARTLLFTTRGALSDAIAQVRAGAPIRNIGRAVERRAKRGGFRVVRDLCGHGGRASHRNLSSARR